MDMIRGEKDLNTQTSSWVPQTPVKPNSAISRPICGESEGNQVGYGYNPTNSVDMNKGFPNWGASGGLCVGNGFSFKSDGLKDIPFGDLMALADSAAAALWRNSSADPNGAGPSNPVIPILDSRVGDNRFEAGPSTPWNMLDIDRWINGSCAPPAASYGNSVSFPYDLNSPARALTDTFFSGHISTQFAPVTPDQSKKSNNYQLNGPHTNLSQISSQERVEVGNEVAITTNQVDHLHHDKEQQQLQSLSSTAISAGLHKVHNPEFDLNKTPQQKPRRRKHRPKVVTEGKAKRNPKPAATPKTAAPKENPTGKRKYVRKNPHNKTPNKPVSEVAVSGSSDPKATEEPAKSCKRTLNFELEGQVREETSLYGPLVENSYDRVASKSVVQLGQGMEAVVEKTQVGIAYDLNRSVNNVLKDYLSMPQAQASSLSIPKTTQMESGIPKPCGQSKMYSKVGVVPNGNSQPVPRSPNYSNCSSSASLTVGEQAKRLKRGPSCMTEPNRTNVIGGYSNSLSTYMALFPESVFNDAVISGMHFPAIQKRKGTQKRPNATTSSILNIETSAVNSERQATACPPTNACANVSMPEARKRTQGSLNATTSSILNIETPAVNSERRAMAYPPTNACADVSMPEARKRTQGSLNATTSSILNTETTAVDCERRAMACPPTNACADVSMPEALCGGAPTLQLNIGSIQRVGEYGQGSQQKDLGCNLSPVRKERTSKKKSKHVSILPVEPAANFGDMQVYEISRHPQTSMGGMEMEPRRKMSAKKRVKRNSSSIRTDAMQRQIPSVDEIAEYLKHLDINRESNGDMCQDLRALVPYNARYMEQNALVLYRQDGTMVPFEGPFDPIRRRKPRPKVDLDDETTRVWKLLLENINSEGIDGTDEDKAKWWEEERRVFQGRADSFIARMHLVQGDRRFSPWKGSVVDSVVGVFLTQNVSDHLSSSAFMSLAARFPLKSYGNDDPCFQEANVIVEEPEECPEQLDYQRTSEVVHGTEKEAEDSNEILGSSSDGVRSTGNSKCHSPDTVEICQRSTAGNEKVQLIEAAETSVGEKVMDDILSSQDSSLSFVDSSVAQSNDRIGSNPNSVSSSSFVELLRAETLLGLKNCQTENVSSYNEGSGCVRNSPDKDASDKSTTSSSLMMPPSSTGHSEVLGHGSLNLFAEESRFSDMLRYNQQICPSEQSEVTAESASQATPIETTNLIGNFKNAGHNGAESSLTEHRHAAGQEINGTSSDISRPKSSKAGKQNANPIDWDSLRVQAQAKGKREKTANTLDSLDWEAVRCADVNVIADAIKERGMNNMLAERIKAFLNRLVEKHGGIDLEWLRDVPPDKAKEYLLSIRGLGLKSVECVRLLTLHHLAFPVDTNVGRIAVRLGWVPLQPLPESLQLHLLELYPVMESIQKYLWPRLCKLDQRTLYELHYQMITFGKVFCTKSKPNCNACPMRGECRHFASAFASARLALPGPVEKSIVMASDDKATNQNATNVGTPMQLPLPLPPPMGNEQRQVHHETSNRELIVEVPTTSASTIEVPSTPAPTVEVPATAGPIIEVPASPEPAEVQVLESDIEDAFLEDPDEIPLIKLNIEELTQNLQNYMQHNMELQEGDMNRALVALTPEAASIPTPKLKNVSRLRTEHQVYELPDSHPLLEGLERRDRDDPSSYLLAIWTPGETPTSIEPPEQSCGSRESGELCDDMTCFSCNSIREANSQTVRGTLLIPCRTAMRGSFPLNGTYFQVNEVFADHASSINPIDVPRAWIWNLPRRTVYFGTSVTSIFKGLSTESIQYCFWRGFVCVRGFELQTRAPRPLLARLHFTASKLKEAAKGKAPDQKQE